MITPRCPLSDQSLNKLKYIDKEAISGLIEDVGTPVQVYFPKFTVDMAGNSRSANDGQPIDEVALIRTRDDSISLDKEGFRYVGSATGYFKYDTKVKPESEVWVSKEEGDGVEVYYVQSTNSSYFEGELKMVKAEMMKRGYEPVTDVEE